MGRRMLMDFIALLLSIAKIYWCFGRKISMICKKVQYPCSIVDNGIQRCTYFEVDDDLGGDSAIT